MKLKYGQRKNEKISAVHSVRADIVDSKLLCVGGRVNVLGFMILKIMTTLVLICLAICGLWYAPKQKTGSDGALFFAIAMFLALGITFMWV